MFGSSPNHPISFRVKQAISFKKLWSIKDSQNSEKGQAVIEYMLVLIITITMLYSLKGVFKSLDDFMYSYMGAYVSCLMEYGELPARGVEAAELKQNQGGGSSGGKVCNSKFDGFTLADGIREKGTSASGPQFGGSKKFTDSKAKTNAAGEKSAGQNTTANADSADSDSNNGKSSSRYANGRIKRSTNSPGTGTADNGSVTTDDKTRVLEDEELAGPNSRGLGGTRSTNIVYERRRYKAITGKLAEDINKKLKPARAPTSRTLQTIDDGNYRIGPRKSVFVPPEIKAANNTEDDTDGFQFGKFIKWLMIAGMAITLFIFFGSQIMSFMNSQEK